MSSSNQRSEPAAVPAKRYFTIGEASRLLGVEPSVLRYWEQQIPQLGPILRRNNRRYYQQRDILLIRQIQSLIQEQGLTIKGVRQHLASKGARADKTQSKQLLRQMIADLESLLRTIKA